MFTANDFLHTEGKYILNEKGDKVYLRGTNLGGWLMREGWMDGAGACRRPVEIQKMEVKENAVVIDLGKATRWNRIRPEQPLSGNYEVLGSQDGENWTSLCSGNFGVEKEPIYKDGYSQDYCMGRRILYNRGDYYYAGTIYLDEKNDQYIKLVCEEPTTEIQIEWYYDMDDYTARAVLEERFGAEEAEMLLAEYQKAYITEDDLDLICHLGFNFVRVPIYWQEIMDKEGNIKVNAWDNIDWLVDNCRTRNIYVLLDYHGAPGGHTAGSITCGQLGSNELWTNETYQEMSCTIVREMANRYKDEPTVAMIDLLNEPVGSKRMRREKNNGGGSLATGMETSEEYKKEVCGMYDRLYQAVRSVDSRHILSLQPFLDYGLLGNPKEHGWENVVYQYHSYGLNWRDHDKVKESMELYLSKHIQAQEEYDIPILAGEFNFWEHEDIWRKWLSELNRLEMHWTNWSFKIMDDNKRDNWSIYYDFSGELVDYYKDSKEEIIRKWSGFTSANYKKNRGLARLMSGFAKEHFEFHVDYGMRFYAPNPLTTTEVREKLPDNKDHWWLECIPSSYTGEEAVPLVLELHGGGRNPYTWIGETSWPLLAEKEGFILVYPCSSKEGAWDIGNDEHYLKDLINHLCEKYHIDRSRIYMGGMSFGNIMTATFANAYPEMLTGGCGCNGPKILPDPDSANVPMMEMVGDMDFTAPGYQHDVDDIMKPRREIHDKLRYLWKEHNNTKDIPAIYADKQNNIAVYEGEESDFAYVEIKGMNHQEALQIPQLVWDYFYTGFRRVDGKIIRTEPKKKWGFGSLDAVFVPGKDKYLLNNEIVESNNAVTGGFTDAYSFYKIDDVVQYMDRRDQEVEIIIPSVYVPYEIAGTIFGGKAISCDEQSLVMDLQGKEYTFYADSVCIKTEDGFSAMKKAALKMNDTYMLPLKDIAILTGNYYAELDGVVYVSDHYVELTHGLARIVKEILA